MNIFEAIQHDDIKLVKELITDINQRDSYGHSLLHWACIYGNVTMIRFLIQKGAKINLINNYGNTPLHHLCAFFKDNLKPIILLLENYNAIPHVKNKNNKTPLDIAKEKPEERKELINYMENFLEKYLNEN